MNEKIIVPFAIYIVLFVVYSSAVQRSPEIFSLSGNYSDDSNLQRTFIMLKPDALQRGLMGKIIERFEDKGLRLAAMKLFWANDSLIEKHYPQHVGKDFFPLISEYMTSGPVVPMIWEGVDAIQVGRQMITGDKTREFCLERFAVILRFNVIAVSFMDRIQLKRLKLKLKCSSMKRIISNGHQPMHILSIQLHENTFIYETYNFIE